MSDHHQHSSLLARPPKTAAHVHEAAPANRPRTRAEAFGRFMEKIFLPQAPRREKKG